MLHFVQNATSAIIKHTACRNIVWLDILIRFILHAKPFYSVAAFMLMFYCKSSKLVFDDFYFVILVANRRRNGMRAMRFLSSLLEDLGNSNKRKVIEFVFLWQDYNYYYNMKHPESVKKRMVSLWTHCKLWRWQKIK